MKNKLSMVKIIAVATILVIFCIIGSKLYSDSVEQDEIKCTNLKLYEWESQHNYEVGGPNCPECNGSAIEVGDITPDN